MSKIPKGSVKTDYNTYLRNSNCSSMVFFDSDEDEVFNIINSLKSNKSPGPLNFSNYFIKLLGSHLSPIICKLINRSWKESCMPKCLKIGKQTPIFKGGDNVLTNYRPITVVNSIAKIFEKSVCSRLVNYLERFDILTDNQFGFRSRHATSHAMIKLFDESLSALDNKNSKVGTVLLDISKAFDCVNHDILLNKLYHYGIRGSVRDWFKSFLTDRTHYVDINGNKSDPYSPTMGVPQGSVLGPILFLIYINDLRNASNILSFSIFADDTSLLLSSERDLYNETFITELKKVMDWFTSNKLLLNYSKSQYMFFGPLYPTKYEKVFILNDLYEVCPHLLILDDEYDSLEELLEDSSLKRKYVKGDPFLKELHMVAPDYLCKEHLTTDNAILVEQNEVKYLGITFDNKLSFSSHINQITQKISKVVGILWKGRSLPLNIKLKIYYSLVYTHLNYAILVWGNIISNNITRGTTSFEHVPISLKNLNTVHNRAVRALVCAKKRDPLSKIYRELNLLKLVDIYYYNLGTFTYTTFNEDNPKLYKNYALYHSKQPHYSTRSALEKCNLSDKIYYDQPNLLDTLHATRYAAAAFWNKIPLSIKQSNSTYAFNSNLKSWLTRDYLSSRECVADIT